MMPRPSLDEIYNATPMPSLDEIYAGTAPKRQVKDTSIRGQISQLADDPGKYLGEVFSRENLSNWGDYANRSFGFTPTEAPESFGDWATRVVPESIAKVPARMGQGLAQGGGALVDAVMQGRFGDAGRDAINLVGGAGSTAIGLQGAEPMKEFWQTDPAGAFLSSAPVTLPLAKGVKTGAQATGRAIAQAPEKLYASSLKMSTAQKLTPAERAKRVQTGLQEGIVPNQKGLKKLQGMIDDTNRKIGNQIAEGANQGGMVNVESIIGRLDDLKQKAADSFDWAGDLVELDTLADNLRNHPKVKDGMIPVDVAQKMKTNTYQKLRKAYGEMKSTQVEGQKALARGIKEELVTQFPELKELNARDTALIGLEDSVSRAVKRIENRDITSFSGPSKAGAGALADLATGSPGLGTATGLALWALDNPGIKARLAIALYKARKATGGSAETVGQIRNNLGAKLKDQRGLVGRDINATSNKMYQGKARNSMQITLARKAEVLRNDITNTAKMLYDQFGPDNKVTGKPGSYVGKVHKNPRFRQLVEKEWEIQDRIQELEQAAKSEQLRPKTKTQQIKRGIYEAADETFDITDGIKELKEMLDDLRSLKDKMFRARSGEDQSSLPRRQQ